MLSPAQGRRSQSEGVRVSGRTTEDTENAEEARSFLDRIYRINRMVGSIVVKPCVGSMAPLSGPSC